MAAAGVAFGPEELVAVFGRDALDAIGSKLSEQFGAGATKTAFGNLISGGLRGLQRSINSLDRQIEIHEAKIAAAIKAGGPAAGRHISSMETEVRQFKAQRDAAQELLDTLKKLQQENQESAPP